MTKKYPVLRKHPELKPLIDDLQFVRSALEEAERTEEVSEGLVKLLEEVYDIVKGSFWRRFLQVSRFTMDDDLCLDLSGDEPVVLYEVPQAKLDRRGLPLN